MKNFHYPHPGFAGCTIRIPEAVRQVALELAREPPMEVEEAVARIQAACPEGKVSVHDNNSGLSLLGRTYPEGSGFVSLGTGEIIMHKGTEHEFKLSSNSWRVIRYVEDETN